MLQKSIFLQRIVGYSHSADALSANPQDSSFNPYSHAHSSVDDQFNKVFDEGNLNAACLY